MTSADWLVGAIGLGVIAAALIGAALLGKGNIERRERFMQQCMADHKEYECTVMWRSGRSGTQFVPLVTPR